MTTESVNDFAWTLLVTANRLEDVADMLEVCGPSDTVIEVAIERIRACAQDLVEARRTIHE